MAYLYLIRCNEFVKIGISYDVDARLSDMRTGNPYPLAILAKFEFADAGYVEGLLHKRFADARVQGEWFRLSDAQVQVLASMCLTLSGVRPEKPGPSAKNRQQFLDLSTLPTESILSAEDTEIVSPYRVERRGDRVPVAFAVYLRGKPVYVGYISEALLEVQ